MELHLQKNKTINMKYFLPKNEQNLTFLNSRCIPMFLTSGQKVLFILAGKLDT